MEKFVSQDAWGDWSNDVSDADAAKAEKVGKFIDEYTGELTITLAKFDQSKTAPGDSDFFQLVVSLQTPGGATRDLKFYYSFKRFEYGPKKALVFAVKLKNLFRALGFEELHIGASQKADSLRVQKKYFKYTESGELPLWAGLKFHGTFAYPANSYHIRKIGTEFVVCDETKQPARFPVVKVLDEATGKTLEAKDSELRNVRMDLLKQNAALSNVPLAFTELERLAPIPGANDALLRAFETGYVAPPVKATSLNDPHSLVEEQANGDTNGLPF